VTTHIVQGFFANTS